jgi:protein-arginine kinase activator protein McsA
MEKIKLEGTGGVEKPVCESCKQPKEMTMETRPYTKEEFDRVLPMLDKYGLTRDEMNYIYNFNNRVFKQNKQPGCGKCFFYIARNLKNTYNKLYN